MRIDKFLKTSRLIKRRTLAKQVAEQGRIKVNGQIAKPSVSVKEGDEITITFGQKVLTVKVLRLANHVLKEDAATMYEIVKEERLTLDD